MIDYEIKIINNFIDKNIAEELSKEFRKTIIINENNLHTFSSTVGYENSKSASQISKNNPIQVSSKKEINSKTTEIILNIKNEIEDFFNIDMDLVHFSYHTMSPGAINGLHSDSTTLDGGPNRSDGMPEEQEFSALLYFNEYEEDFGGGELNFPNQGICILPKVGDLIIFRGNHIYAHSVSKVTRGLRDTMVLFFGRKGNVSNRTITSFVD